MLSGADFCPESIASAGVCTERSGATHIFRQRLLPGQSARNTQLHYRKGELISLSPATSSRMQKLLEELVYTILRPSTRECMNGPSRSYHCECVYTPSLWQVWEPCTLSTGSTLVEKPYYFEGYCRSTLVVANFSEKKAFQ